jgi:LmbE family N-acetylglucosaminyl deacetylase
MGGTAVKYARLGHKVKFVSLTNGNAGHHIMGGGQLARRRQEETRKVFEMTGIEYQVLDNDDGKLQADLATRENVIRIIREFRPDLIFTHRPNDYHPDHRNTGILVQDSSFLVIVPNICPLTPALDYQPVVLHMHDNFRKPVEFSPHIIVDIDDVMDTKMKMFHCHTSQFYEWLAYESKRLDQVPSSEEERLEWLTRQRAQKDEKVADLYRKMLVGRYGEEAGARVRYAEAFEISEYGGSLPEGDIPLYFPF